MSPCFGNGLRYFERNMQPDLGADAIGMASDMPGEIISLLATLLVQTRFMCMPMNTMRQTLRS